VARHSTALGGRRCRCYLPVLAEFTRLPMHGTWPTRTMRGFRLRATNKDQPNPRANIYLGRNAGASTHARWRRLERCTPKPSAFPLNPPSKKMFHQLNLRGDGATISLLAFAQSLHLSTSGESAVVRATEFSSKEHA
jgi:hypothetical protein